MPAVCGGLRLFGASKIQNCIREHEQPSPPLHAKASLAIATTMLPPQLPRPAHLSLAPTTSTSSAISCSSGGGRRRRRPKPKHVIAFPPPPLRRLVSTSLRLLLPRSRPLGGGWLGRRGRRRAAPAEEVVALVLSLAFGDRLAVLAESWRASGLGQALGIWAAVWGRGRRRRRTVGLRRLAAFLLGIAFCALVSHFRGAAFLEGLVKTAGGRKLARILLH